MSRVVVIRPPVYDYEVIGSKFYCSDPKAHCFKDIIEKNSFLFSL